MPSKSDSILCSIWRNITMQGQFPASASVSPGLRRSAAQLLDVARNPGQDECREGEDRNLEEERVRSGVHERNRRRGRIAAPRDPQADRPLPEPADDDREHERRSRTERAQRGGPGPREDERQEPERQRPQQRPERQRPQQRPERGQQRVLRFPRVQDEPDERDRRVQERERQRDVSEREDRYSERERDPPARSEERHRRRQGGERRRGVRRIEREQ